MQPKTSEDGDPSDNNAHDDAPDEETIRPSASRRALASVPTLAILAVLAAAGFWGHHSGWTLPKFEELAHAESGEKEDWCDEHSVPQSICVECNLDKYPWETDFGWCEIHGVANCPECHPEVAQVNGEPQKPKFDTVAALAVMDRQINGHTCTLHVRRLQVASDDAERKLGIEFELVSEREMTDESTALAEVVYDPASVARLSSLVPGRIWQVRKNLGDTVEQGDIGQRRVGLDAEKRAVAAGTGCRAVDPYRVALKGGADIAQVMRQGQGALTKSDGREGA